MCNHCGAEWNRLSGGKRVEPINEAKLKIGAQDEAKLKIGAQDEIDDLFNELSGHQIDEGQLEQMSHSLENTERALAKLSYILFENNSLSKEEIEFIFNKRSEKPKQK